MTTAETAAPAADRLPEARLDKIPLVLVPALMLLVLPFISVSSWVTLTVAGLAMGMMIFLMASGLTLVFGLMDVLNFAHSAFITVGAYVATSVLLHFTTWMQEDSFLLNMAAVLPAVAAAMIVAGLVGWFFERVIISPVYGEPLKQILITMGGLIVAEQLITVIWGPDIIPLQKPLTVRGSFEFGDIAVEKYRLLAVGVGLVVFAAMMLVLNRTRIGLLIRAGVEDAEMVESLGYRIHRLFIGVFVAGAGLAGLGGAMWAMYQENLSVSIGSQMIVLIFIVIIIGGMGSVGGCFVGSILVGLLANYVGFLSPKVALGSNILLMVVVLLWRPQGLYSVKKS